VSLLNRKAKNAIDLDAEELLRVGRSWQHRISPELVDRLRFEAPPLVMRAPSGKLEFVESAFRTRRSSEHVEKGETAAQPPSRFEAIFSGAASSIFEVITVPKDSSGVGLRSHYPFHLFSDGIVYFSNGIASGWSPDEGSSAIFWLLDSSESGLQDFKSLLLLHESVRHGCHARVSPRWLWDHVLAWIRCRISEAKGLSLSQHLEAAFAVEPDRWEVALLVDGVQLSDQWEAEDEPVAAPWLGHRIVDGRFIISRILDSLVPGHDPDTFEKNNAWLESEGPHRAIVDNYDWLLFSAIAGDRYGALEGCLGEAQNLCALLSVFDATPAQASPTPSILKNRGELCAVLIPVSVDARSREVCKPVFLDELPQAFPPRLQSSEVLVLQDSQNFRTLSTWSAGFQMLRNQDHSDQPLPGAILSSIRRLARARREPDPHERVFLLVSALDALLVGDESDRGARSHTDVLVTRFCNLARLAKSGASRAETERLVKTAWRVRCSFAHGDRVNDRLGTEALLRFESLTISIARLLFLGAGLWDSLDSLRKQLDCTSEIELKSLDDLDRTSWGSDGGEAN
jgi:hypothetical protein